MTARRLFVHGKDTGKHLACYPIDRSQDKFPAEAFTRYRRTRINGTLLEVAGEVVFEVAEKDVYRFQVLMMRGQK